MLNSSLCDYRDAYLLVSGTTKVPELAAGGGNNNIQVLFKNSAPFIDSISKISNTQIDNTKDIDIVNLMYNLIEYSNKYLKTTKSLW